MVMCYQMISITNYSEHTAYILFSITDTSIGPNNVFLKSSRVHDPDISMKLTFTNNLIDINK